MALVVQNSSGNAVGANAYLSVARFQSYHDDRGNDYSAFTTAEIEFAIIKGTDYVDQRFSYPGQKLGARNQHTQWPRLNAYDRDRYYISGIPQEIENATAEYAFRALSGALNPDPVRDSTGQTVTEISEEVGPLKESKKFGSASGSSGSGSLFSLPIYPGADQILLRAGLVASSGNVRRG